LSLCLPPTTYHKKNLPKIIAAIDNAAPGSFQAVDCGTFSRKKMTVK